MDSKKQKQRIDQERIRQNLLAMVFAEAVTQKEKAWELMLKK
jgi:hypothetical protein